MGIERTLLLCAMLVTCASFNTACGKKGLPPTPKEVARTNLFKEQVKTSQRSETWDGHNCLPPVETESDVAVCTVMVYDEFGKVVSSRLRTYKCSVKPDSFCIEIRSRNNR